MQPSIERNRVERVGPSGVFDVDVHLGLGYNPVAHSQVLDLGDKREHLGAGDFALQYESVPSLSQVSSGNQPSVVSGIHWQIVIQPIPYNPWMLPDGVILPELSEPYATALAHCVESIFERYEVVAIVACGTIVRGAPDRRSDLDIHVLHRGTFRQRIQKLINGVPCEVFVNPPSRVQGYFDAERQSRRPVFAHMYATGFIVFDPEGVAADVVRRARETLAVGPGEKDELMKAIAYYTSATMFEDAEDLLKGDLDTALLLMGQAVYGLVQCRLSAGPGWTPRQKDFLRALEVVDPEAARLVKGALHGEPMTRFDHARELCVHLTGADGFFEWESLPEEV